jgi:hypothetical protein
MNERQTAHMAVVPSSAVNIVTKAYDRVGGRANAIKAMCLHCTGYNRRDIRECSSTICPLQAWRPYQAKLDDDDDFLDLPDDGEDDDDDLLAMPPDDDDEL